MPITELQHQLEAVREEAFAAGYTTAMKKVRELTARAIHEAGDAAVPSRNGRGTGRRQTGRPERMSRSGSTRRPRKNGHTPGRTAKAGRSIVRRPRRGTNALLVAEVLKSVAPRALPQAEIRRALQDKGKTMSFPSLGYSLRQLEARKAAKQSSNGKTWRYAGG